MSVHIQLRDGFSNDFVTITVNGKEIYRKSGVSTDLTISFADAVEVPVEGPIANLAVAIKGRQKLEKEIRVQKTPFVDVWIIEGKIELRESENQVPIL